MSIKDGGPAFPSVWRNEGDRNATAPNGDVVAPQGEILLPGMSLRDFFAAAALPSVISAYIEANGRCIGTEHVASNCAVHAYRFADAMLAEREKGKP